jgi:hypothetical protein
MPGWPLEVVRVMEDVRHGSLFHEQGIRVPTGVVDPIAVRWRLRRLVRTGPSLGWSATRSEYEKADEHCGPQILARVVLFGKWEEDHGHAVASSPRPMVERTALSCSLSELRFLVHVECVASLPRPWNSGHNWRGGWKVADDLAGSISCYRPPRVISAERLLRLSQAISEQCLPVPLDDGLQVFLEAVRRALLLCGQVMHEEGVVPEVVEPLHALTIEQEHAILLDQTVLPTEELRGAVRTVTLEDALTERADRALEA